MKKPTFQGAISVSEPINKENCLMAPPVNEQYVVYEKGNTTAVILPIEEYKKIPSILQEAQDHKETRILSQSVDFKKLVKKLLEDVRANRIKPWKEIWDEDRNHQGRDRELAQKA